MRALVPHLTILLSLGCGGGLPDARAERGIEHPAIHDEWVGTEGQPASVEARGGDEAPSGDAKPAATIEPRLAPVEAEGAAEVGIVRGAEPEPEPRTELREPTRRERARGRPAPRGMLSEVGETLPVRPEEEREPSTTAEPEPAEPEPAAPERPAPRADEGPARERRAMSPSLGLETETGDDSRFRRPQGTASRVAGGPPEGFERPPGTTSRYGHAWPGGFDRAPGTADDVPPPNDTSP